MEAGGRRHRVGSASRTAPGFTAGHCATARAIGRAGQQVDAGRGALRRLYAEHSQTRSKWDVIAAAIGTRRTASAAEQRWLLIKNKSAPAPSAPAPAAAEPPAKKRKKSEKRVEKKKKKQRSRVWDLNKKKYVTS